MAYTQVPIVSESTELNIENLLENIAVRKEFHTSSSTASSKWDGFKYEKSNLFLPGLRLNGAQLFIRNFENPDTEYMRVLIKWQTGTGKSIAAISISHEFIRQFRVRAALGAKIPMVCIISFTARETIQEDMLRYPEFGFVSALEVEELRTLRITASLMGPASAEARHLSGFIGTLRRRITDITRGGYYQFYGYKEFANRLFIITVQGMTNGFDIQTIYSRADGAFGQRLIESVKKGDVIINENLLDSLRGGLLIADEIHNVYNILENNNYGIAIQYVLDALGDDAPRAVFMSATPITGSAAEIVDLLNLLVPRSALPNGMLLRRNDFFIRSAMQENNENNESSSFIVSQLREGALKKISHLAAGRVSFLLDSDINSYPKRLFVGDEISGIPYLRITPCPMSLFHARTLEHEQSLSGADIASGLASNAYTLYDMAFPNPKFSPDAAANDNESYGLHKSGETPIAILNASEEWRASAGIIVEKSSETGTHIYTGSFLGPERLHLYSTKFSKLVEETLKAIRDGPGKIMIYHHRVRMSGVLLLQEILRMNGFADELSTPTDLTICSICGIAMNVHNNSASHMYMPARFVIAHSDIDRTIMIRSIAKYNASLNNEGHQYRIIIGSKIIREGLNFRGVRHQFITSLPTDYPTMVQVFGRVVRKDSHNELPIDSRNVKIHIFVSTRQDNRPSPELQRYIDKGREYLIIQEVERMLHIYAIDGVANYDRIRTALHVEPNGELKASLDALPYTPIINPKKISSKPTNFATFLAYGHGEKEVAVIASICRVLFQSRPVWTYADLWEAVKSGPVKGISYDSNIFEEGNFALALENLLIPAGSPLMVVSKAKDFYIASSVLPNGKPFLDIESYIRDVPISPKISIKVSDYVRTSRAGQNWKVHLQSFERAYLLPNAESTPELSLIEYSAAFHYTLIRQLISSNAVVTIDDERVRELYRRFRIVITVADASTPEARRIFRGSTSEDPLHIIGYVTHESISLYDGTSWYNASHADFAIGRRHKENDIVIGVVTDLVQVKDSNRDEVSFSGAEYKFKIRPPIQKLQIDATMRNKGRGVNQHNDIRNLARGAVCETRPREELALYATKLRKIVASIGVTPQATRGGSIYGGSARMLIAHLDYAAAYDRAIKKRFPGAAELCDTLRLHLLALEEDSRSPINGMTSGIRWLYLFNDRPPTVSALIGKTEN